MIATYTALRTRGLTGELLDSFMDRLHDVGSTCDDVSDLTVGADLIIGLVEIEMTIAGGGCFAAACRAAEIIGMADGDRLGAAREVRAYLIDA